MAIVLHSVAGRLLPVRLTVGFQQGCSLLSQTLSSPGSFTPVSAITLWTVLYCTVPARTNFVKAEATPLPNQRSSFKLICIFCSPSCSEVQSPFLSMSLQTSSASFLHPFAFLKIFFSLSGVGFPASTTRGSVVSLPSF